jgi:hypothetical protein
MLCLQEKVTTFLLLLLIGYEPAPPELLLVHGHPHEFQVLLWPHILVFPVLWGSDPVHSCKPQRVLIDMMVQLLGYMDICLLA